MKAFAPGSIGNVGPGFDVLGLAVDGIGDTVSVELTEGPARVDEVTGFDAELVPRDPARNTAAIAAIAWLRAHGDERNPIVRLHKGLPMAGGMGGSAASSVAGAYAAKLERTIGSAGGADARPKGREALQLSHEASTDVIPSVSEEPGRAGGTKHMPSATQPPGFLATLGMTRTEQVSLKATDIIAAALEAESLVSGRHLDNLAASALGGLTISRSVDPIDVIAVRVLAPWWIALVTPDAKIETKAARAMLPELWPRIEWVQQMANTVALAHAFASGDGELLARALDDRYAEPIRAALIPHYYDIKRAAVIAGAFGCAISGSGPTMFAVCEDEDVARRACDAMQNASGGVRLVHVGPIATEGVRRA
jgi:homoserine kinase